MRGWVRRAAELHHELAAIADADPRWWLLAGGAAATEQRRPRETYVISDAEPGADTFIGYRAPQPADPFVDAVARAKAARQALRELDGELPGQPLAVTVRRDIDAAIAPSTLDTVAFAIGDRVITAKLDEPNLVEKLKRGGPLYGASPFACVVIGEEPIATVRHTHRRAWTEYGGPWLGISRAGGMVAVSTCHFVVDGYGHARITGRIAELAPIVTNGAHTPLPPLRPVPEAIPLDIAWREFDPPVARAIPMAYALGRVLHRRAGQRDARFSPTFQIPIAPGDRGDATRWRRRVVPSIASVRFEDGQPEPYEIFEARVRDTLAREAEGRGLCSRLLAATRAAPTPLAWKRKTISASRPGWITRFADVIGGRACLSRIHVDAPLPPSCAVSSPATGGGHVLTVLDAGGRAAITACGADGASALLDELFELL